MSTNTAKFSIALDENDNRVHISMAKRGGIYYCPLCKTRMIPKLGTIKMHHYAHQSLEACDEWYENKGPWHRQMQSLFPFDCQEVIVERNGEKHIADICLEKPNGQHLIIEFQHSPMDHEEFVKRTTFWRGTGDDIIWVFDVTDKLISEVIGFVDTYCDKMFRWKKPISTFGTGYMDEIPIFLYMQPEMIKWNGAEKVDRDFSVEKPFFMWLQSCGCDDSVEDHSHFYFGFELQPYDLVGGKVYESTAAFKRFVNERMLMQETRPFQPNLKLRSRAELEDSYAT